MYAVKTVVEPAGEPITLEEAKAHLRVPTNNEDGNIERIYIPAARRRVESETGRQLINATLRLSLDRFPAGQSPILIPRSPLVSVQSIRYVGGSGETQLLDENHYIVDSDSEPGRILSGFGRGWPSVRQRGAPATVQVEFVAGYGEAPSDVPAGLREAMLLMIGHYYYHREEVVIGAAPAVLPRAVGDLLQSYSYGDEFTNYGV